MPALHVQKNGGEVVDNMSTINSNLSSRFRERRNSWRKSISGDPETIPEDHSASNKDAFDRINSRIGGICDKESNLTDLTDSRFLKKPSKEKGRRKRTESIVEIIEEIKSYFIVNQQVSRTLYSVFLNGLWNSIKTEQYIFLISELSRRSNIVEYIKEKLSDNRFKSYDFQFSDINCSFLEHTLPKWELEELLCPINEREKSQLALDNDDMSRHCNDHVSVMLFGNLSECNKRGCGLQWFSRALVMQYWVNCLYKMDQDGTLDISFDEWRDYLLFHPSHDLEDILKYWRHATCLDCGEGMTVPDEFSHREWDTGAWWKNLVAGGLAGMVSRTCTAPLDRLKVFLQVGKCPGGQKFTGLGDCWRFMLREGGYKSLWRGNGINVVKIVPENALKFAAYEQMKRVILVSGDQNRTLEIYERMMAGASAGALSQSTIYPLEVLKTRLALRKSGQYKGVADAAVKIYQQEGVWAFYRGYVPNLIGIIPYAGIDLAVYETIKNKYIASHSAGEVPPPYVTVTCGAISSMCGQLASYPLALVRTRMQAASAVVEGGAVAMPLTLKGVASEILQKEGPKGFYRGIVPNFMKVAPAVSISYLVYEEVRRAFGIKMT